MIKKVILTYYAVWYMAHKNSKHADDFGYFWLSALLMVGESIGALMTVVYLFVLGIIGAQTLSEYIFYILFFLPFPIIYYLIFKKYGVDKNAEDESFDYLKICKRKIIQSWIFFIGINIIMSVFAPYFRHLPTLVNF